MAEKTQDGVVLVTQEENIEIVCCRGTYFKLETINDGHVIVTILDPNGTREEIDFIRLSTSRQN